ncbi:MAG: rubrerythrin family protein [Alphaproteobacteria bacterium]|nr:rubrerythrin family protein [Alphaproteobacteria bacterium]
MTKSIKGTQTERNLLISFAGEGQARNRYTFWASQAKKEGFVQISNIFTLTANQEKEHAERFFKFLEGGDVEIGATYPAGLIRSTLENLREAAQNEHEEGEILYPAFASIAEKEGFSEIAAVWRAVSVSEKGHEKRYMELADNIFKGTVFKRAEKVVWQCSNCGYIMTGEEPPEKCPSCDHEKGYFEVMMHNW